MYDENKYGSRTAFLKKISLAFVSVLGLGITGLNFQKSSEKRIASISNEEANDIIRNMRSSKGRQLKPEPPPNTNTIIVDKLSPDI